MRRRLNYLVNDVVHNCIAHPLLVLCPPVGNWLHEATAKAYGSERLPIAESEPDLVRATSDNGHGECGFQYMDHYCRLAPHSGNSHYDSATGRKFSIVAGHCYST